MRIGLRLATLLMKYGNRHSRFCGHDCNTPSFIQPHNDQPSVATRRAFDDGPSFFQRFEGTLSPHDFSSQDLLDIGSGCGGRTAYYLRYGNPRSIVGLDISHPRSDIARRSVELFCADNRIHFTVGLGPITLTAASPADSRGHRAAGHYSPWPSAAHPAGGAGLLHHYTCSLQHWVVYHRFIPVALPAGVNLVQGIAEFDKEGRFGMPLSDPDVLTRDAEWNNRPDYGGHMWTPDGIERAAAASKMT